MRKCGKKKKKVLTFTGFVFCSLFMAQAEEEPFVNFDEGNEAEAPSASKRNKTSASEGDLNVWSINKVIMYRPDRSKVRIPHVRCSVCFD